MGLLLQGGNANIANIQFEGGDGNKTVVIPAAGGTVVTGTGNQTIAGTKTFSSQPVSSATQGTSTNDLVKYGTINTANSAPIKTALNAGGTAPIYACRAWVNFNGTGTVAIRASGNVSSITDVSTGRYDVNTTTAMPDLNYAAIGSSGNASTANRWVTVDCDVRTTSKIPIVIANESGAANDVSFVNVAFFR